MHYDADGTWVSVGSNISFQLQYMRFNHNGEIDTYGLVWQGFTPARYADLDYATVTNWYDHQFQVPSKGGVTGVGTPYIVAYWNTQENETTPADERSCRITFGKTLTSENLTFRPMSVMVELNCVAAETIEHGNAFTSAFTTGDWFMLTAHGVHADGSESTADFYLADYRDGEAKLCTSWTRFNLSGLGNISELYFTLSSTDSGQWGMNTPAYFALDKLEVSAVLPE